MGVAAAREKSVVAWGLFVRVAAVEACRGQVAGDGCGPRAGFSAVPRPWCCGWAQRRCRGVGGAERREGGPGCRGRLRTQSRVQRSPAAVVLRVGSAALSRRWRGRAPRGWARLPGTAAALGRVCCRRRAGLRAKSRALAAGSRLQSAGCRPQLAGEGAAGVRARTGGREGHPTASRRRRGAGLRLRRGCAGVGSRYGARPFRLFIPCGFDFGEVEVEEGADGGGDRPLPFIGDSLEA